MQSACHRIGPERHETVGRDHLSELQLTVGLTLQAEGALVHVSKGSGRKKSIDICNASVEVCKKFGLQSVCNLLADDGLALYSSSLRWAGH